MALGLGSNASPTSKSANVRDSGDGVNEIIAAVKEASLAISEIDARGDLAVVRGT